MKKLFTVAAFALTSAMLHMSAAAAPIIDQNHPAPYSPFCAVTTTDWCGQSFVQTNSNISGAGVYLMGSEGARSDAATLTISIYSNYGWDGLSGLVASGSTAIEGNYFGFVDIFWSPAAVSAATTYYMVLSSSNNAFASFSTSTYGNGDALFRGSNYTGYDLTFRTFADDGADNGAGEVPEPGSLAILALGLVGLASARRKKRA